MSSTSSSASNSASSFPSPSSLSHRFASNAAAAPLPAEVTACRYLHAIGHVAAREHARHGRAGARAVVQDVAGMVGVEFDGCPAGRTWCECVRSPQDGANVHFHCPLNTAAPPPPPPAAPHTSPPPADHLCCLQLAARSINGVRRTPRPLMLAPMCSAADATNAAAAASSCVRKAEK